MHAFRLTAPYTVAVESVPQPDPGPGDVLVKVGAAGACHSDLHVIDAPDALGMPMPLTLGHEIAGWVHAFGSGVDGYDAGQPVAVYGIVGCGRCGACLAGRDNACRTRSPGGIGLGRDGGMADYVVVPARQLVPIDTLDVTQAAPLTDAALTPYHAMRLTRRGLTPGSTCVVIGVGGLGHMAVQLLRATTATRVIAVDAREVALALAQEVGAHEVVLAGDSPEATARVLRALVPHGRGGVDVVLDCVGSPTSVQLAKDVVATGGDIAIVGLAGGALPVGFGTVPLEVRVVVPFWGTKAELADVIALGQRGAIRAHVERFALEDAALAYDRLRRGDIHGRAVVVPGMRA